MKIIFLTMSLLTDVNARGIYSDLMRLFRDKGHDVYIVSPRERRLGISTHEEQQDGIHILGVKTLNIQKTNVIEKGFGTILLENQFKRAIRKYWGDISFDLILYSTPPITLTDVIRQLKKRNPKAITYLLLKDIFPQNAVDLEMFSKKSLFYKFFRRKEISLYRTSDFIGCMSPANVRFIIENNRFIDPNSVEVAPNSIRLSTDMVSVRKNDVRKKYDLPIDKPIFIYGGNLGRPQGIEFLIQCMEANSLRTDCHFLIVGDGTEYSEIATWYRQRRPKNISLLNSLPKYDYDQLVQSCDIGLIFLDHRFTIPNYPSRLLSYLEYKMPIIAATDPNTDIGRLAEENGYGYWCESNDVSAFSNCVDKYLSEPASIKQMGMTGYDYLCKNYLVDNTYSKIVSHFT